MIFWYCICKYHGGAQQATKEGPAEDLVNQLNREKCVLRQTQEHFLEHLHPSGVRSDQEKVEAIGQLSQPDNMQELKRVLGMVKYLGNYIPNLSTTV